MRVWLLEISALVDAGDSNAAFEQTILLRDHALQVIAEGRNLGHARATARLALRVRELEQRFRYR